MYELFVMALKEYWNEQGDSIEEVTQNVKELQEVLTEHYEKTVSWDEPVPDVTNDEDEINVCAFSDVQFVALQAVAGALELGESLDDLEIGEGDEVYDSPIFERIGEYTEDNDLQKFPHLLTVGSSCECFFLPVDLPFVAQINTEDEDDDECDCEDAHCHCDDDDCDCDCEDDESCIEISSLQAVRKELDIIAKAMDIDTSVTEADLDELTFDDDDNLRDAKVAWYLMSAHVNEALKANLPLIMQYKEADEAYEDEFDDEDEDEDED